jgi:Holliday junction resolvase RusA-like endonuclease
MLWASSNILSIVGKLTACKSVAETIQCIKDHFKSFVKNSGKYQDWMRSMQPIIHEQLCKEIERHKNHCGEILLPLDLVSVKIYHYWKDDIERDLDNKQSTIYDLLTVAKVIVNDNWQCLYKIHSECENYKDQIVQALTTVDVTYMIT